MEHVQKIMDIDGWNYFKKGESIDIYKNADFKVIGEGDDGVVVLKPDKTTAVKIFIMRGQEMKRVQTRIDFYRAVSKDQALRELKAITLLSGHKNFLKATTAHPQIEMIEYNLTEITRVANSPSLQFQYVENLMSIDNALLFFGFKEGVDSVEHVLIEVNYKNSMNFEHRNTLFKYMLHQLFSATEYMHSKRIVHRDLDSVNVKVIYPSIVIKIMDFAKADVPRIDRFPDTENPENIVKTAKIEMKKLESDTTGLVAEQKRAINELWQLSINQYTSPFHDMGFLQLIPPRKEINDLMQLFIIINKFTVSYINKFQWSYDTENEQSIIDENTLLCNFISHCEQLSLTELISATQVDMSEVESSLPLVDYESAIHYLTTFSSKKEHDLNQPRFVIHSNVWNRSNQTI